MLVLLLTSHSQIFFQVLDLCLLESTRKQRLIRLVGFFHDRVWYFRHLEVHDFFGVLILLGRGFPFVVPVFFCRELLV